MTMLKQKKSEPVYRKDRHPAKKYSDWLIEEAEKQDKSPKDLMAFRTVLPKSLGAVKASRIRLRH